MQSLTPIERTATWFDSIAATLLVACGVALLYIARDEAAEEVLRNGRNIDHGAMEAIAAVVYVMPSAVLFAIAAVAMLRGWRLRWLAQGAAGFWLIGAPVIVLLVRLATMHAP